MPLGLDFLIDRHQCPTKECVANHNQEFEEWIIRLTAANKLQTRTKLAMLRDALIRLVPA